MKRIYLFLKIVWRKNQDYCFRRQAGVEGCGDYSFGEGSKSMSSKQATFIDKSQRAIRRHIAAERFCGVYILCVDGRRVGHALATKKDAQTMKHFLSHSLEDLERFFTTQDGARRRNW